MKEEEEEERDSEQRCEWRGRGEEAVVSMLITILMIIPKTLTLRKNEKDIPHAIGAL